MTYLSGINVRAILIDVRVISPQRVISNTRCGGNTLAGIPGLDDDDVSAVLTLSSQADDLCNGREAVELEKRIVNQNSGDVAHLPNPEVSALRVDNTLVGRQQLVANQRRGHN